VKAASSPVHDYAARCCNYPELSVSQLALQVGQHLQTVTKIVAAAMGQSHWAFGNSLQLLQGEPARQAPTEQHSAAVQAVGAAVATTRSVPRLSEVAEAVAEVVASYYTGDRRAAAGAGLKYSRDRRWATEPETPAFRSCLVRWLRTALKVEPVVTVLQMAEATPLM
jgi:hypothetical protein